MKQSKLAYWSVTVALVGFLFGFDTIVINGADKSMQELWNTSPWFHGVFIMSMALWGTVLGSLLGGIPCNRYGRKPTLIVIGLLFLISALGSGLATSPYWFSFFRFIGGVGVGASSVAAPIFIAEIAPADKRGRLVAQYQFFLVMGILVAFLSNWLIGKYFEPSVSWRWMLGIEALPAAIFCFMVLGVPESPRWLLLERGDEQGARSVLSQILGSQNEVDKEVEEILASKAKIATQASTGFFSGKYNIPILLAFCLAMFNQLSGINFVFYYAERIMGEAGMPAATARAAGIWLGVVNFIFTYVGLYLIDKVGRKKLMYAGSIGYIFFLSMVAYAFATEATGTWVVAMICGFIGAHAIGQGAVIWVFISEIFPNKVRDNGMALGSGTHWVFAALITAVTPTVLTNFTPSTVFSFFAFMMVLQLLWVWKVMPETKGVPLEDLEKQLLK